MFIFHCRNLPKIHDKLPDTYVKIYTVPDRFKSKQDKRNKSVTIKNTCNPVYEERLEILMRILISI